MRRFLGKFVTIANVRGEGKYCLEEDMNPIPYNYTDEMFEGLAKEEVH